MFRKEVINIAMNDESSAGESDEAFGMRSRPYPRDQPENPSVSEPPLSIDYNDKQLNVHPRTSESA